MDLLSFGSFIDRSAVEQGPSGTQGPSGPLGPSGAQGPSGTQGPSGLQGPSGPQGPSGSQGPSGVQGPSGPSGPSGAQGATGATGPAGTPGIAGIAWFAAAGGVVSSGNCIQVGPNSGQAACPPTAGFSTNTAGYVLGPIPSGGATISNLYAQSNTTPSGSDTYTVAVLDNGTSVFTCTVTSAAATCTNTGSVSVAAGHYLEVQITNNGAAAAARWRVSFRY